MWNKILKFMDSVGTVVSAGFILGVFCAAFLLPIFATWKFIFSTII